MTAASSDGGLRSRLRRQRLRGRVSIRKGRRRENAPDKPQKPERAGPKGWVKTIVGYGIAFVVIHLFVFRTFVIDSGSMENTLLVGDYLVVNQVAMGGRIPFTEISIPGYADPRHGDIVVFDPHHEDDMFIVKRVVGLPGDTLQMQGRILYLNGVAQDEPYVVTGPEPDVHDPNMRWQQRILLGGARDEYHPTRDTWGPLVVPEGHYFLLGDNRNESLDSRIWGSLERWRIRGRVGFIYFSYNRDSTRPFPFVREIRLDRIFQRPS